MSETTPPGASGATPEPPKAADAAQKKQTVRISLPPKPTGGPSIRLPAAGAPPSAPTAPRPAPPASAGAAAPSAAPGMSVGMAGHGAKPAGPAPSSAMGSKPSTPAPRASAPPARAKVSGLDIGLAVAALACSVATAAVLFFSPTAV